MYQKLLVRTYASLKNNNELGKLASQQYYQMLAINNNLWNAFTVLKHLISLDKEVGGHTVA
jgi:hypothetical protein